MPNLKVNILNAEKTQVIKPRFDITSQVNLPSICGCKEDLIDIEPNYFPNSGENADL